MNQYSHKYLMPEISSHQDKLALENTELLEEYTIDLDLNKKQLIRKQVLQLLYLIDMGPSIHLNQLELNYHPLLLKIILIIKL